MTVDELIAVAQELSANGHGNVRLGVWDHSQDSGFYEIYALRLAQGTWYHKGFGGPYYVFNESKSGKDYLIAIE